jgi:hypothetical protein
MFCGCAGHLDEFCFHRKRIEKRCFDFARNSYRDEFSDFLPRSHLALLLVLYLISVIDLTTTHMVLVHERTTLCLDALVTAHILIVVIVSRVGLVYLLEGLTLTLGPDTWTVHISLVVVFVPLGQVVNC